MSSDDQLIAAEEFIASRNHLWGAPCLGYNVQLVFGEKTREALRSVQNQVALLSPEMLLVCPPESLHVTLARLIGTRGNYPVPKEAMWREIGPACLSGLDSICSMSKSFRLRFGQLRAFPDAVVAVATDNGQVSGLRQRIISELPIPAGTVNSFDQIHCTLFRRQANPTQSDELAAIVSGILIDIDERVETVVVRREIVFPSLECEEVGRYRLRH